MIPKLALFNADPLTDDYYSLIDFIYDGGAVIIGPGTQMLNVTSKLATGSNGKRLGVGVREPPACGMPRGDRVATQVILVSHSRVPAVPNQVITDPNAGVFLSSLATKSSSRGDPGYSTVLVCNSSVGVDVPNAASDAMRQLPGFAPATDATWSSPAAFPDYLAAGGAQVRDTVLGTVLGYERIWILSKAARSSLGLSGVLGPPGTGPPGIVG
mgnify:CR=1 FL=1